MNITCPSCKYKNTVEGDCTFRGPATCFTPDGLKFFTFSTCVDLLDRFNACLECGHVWSSVDTDELKKLLNKSAKPQTKEGLNL